MPSLEDLLPKPGDVIATKYRVERTLGTGGMGAVYEVVHVVTQKRFAVKWLLPSLAGSKDAVTRFIREAQVAGRVQHPNVVEIYDVGEEDGSFYMVMELLQGETLSDRMARRGKLPAAEACALLVPVLGGVHAAHTAGVIHRDLKPENIFASVTSTGVQLLKVLDFGISKMEQAGDTTLSATRAGTVMGTPHYMAPEQVRSQPVDARTDVYAVGVILYEMLGGVVPFDAQSYGDLVLQVMTETPTALSKLAPETPSALVDVVTRAMARDPAQRYASMAELSAALEPFAAGAHVPAFVQTAASPPAPATTAHTTLRPKTPLSTESTLEHTGPRVTAVPARAIPVPLILLTLAIAVAVVGLGVVAIRLLGDDEDAIAEPARESESARTAAAASGPEPIELPLGADAPATALPPMQPVAMPEVAPATPAAPTAATAPSAVMRTPSATPTEPERMPPEAVPLPARPARSSRTATRPTARESAAGSVPRRPSAPAKSRRTPDLSLDDF